MKKWLTICFAALVAVTFALPAMVQAADLQTGPGFKVSWTLDPRTDEVISQLGPGFGARSVRVGMDFDNDGRREILFTTDETLAPEGPGEGTLDVFLYEAVANDTYEYVWHYSMTELSNSLPALEYGDMDQDGLWEIFFGVPTIDSPNKLFVFEQDESGMFPDSPTLTYDFGMAPELDFRPAGFKLGDADGDGEIELAAVSRTTRELVVISLATDGLDAFAAFQVEFMDSEAGEGLLDGGAVYDVDIVDFDGDGNPEVWVNTWDLWSMTIFESAGPDAYVLATDINQAKLEEDDPGETDTNGFAFQDVDGDEMLEAWFVMSDGKLYFIDDTDDVGALTMDDVVTVGTFSDTKRSRGGDVGDIDRDGRPDIVGTWGRDEKVSRIEYQELGSPADSASYDWSIILDSSGDTPQERWYPVEVSPVDLDGDGFREVVVTNLWADEEGQPMLVVLEYSPETAESTPENWETMNTLQHEEIDDFYATDPSGNSRTVIGGFDLDQDGAKEMIITDYEGHRVFVFEYNMAADVFEMVWESPIDTLNNRQEVNSSWANPRIVTVSDLDGDDRWEIVFPLASEPSGWYVFEWDGVVGSDNYGTIYSSVVNSEINVCCPQDYTAFRGDHEAINVADVDMDGKQELLIAIRRNDGEGQRGTLVTSVEGDIEFEAAGGGFETWVTEFFVDRVNYGGGSPYEVLPADLDGDGSYELVNHTWNYFNFYNVDVLGADTYAAPDTGSATKNLQATYPDDHVSLFGGDAGDINGDGDDEAFFTNYYTGDLWVLDYEAGDDVLSIDENHMVKVVDGFAPFYASVFDVDQDGRANVLSGGSFPQTIVSAELMGDNPRDPMSYMTEVIYTGEPNDIQNIVVKDSAGIITTNYSNTSRFASKVEAHTMGQPIDFDDDDQYELLASFQSNTDSVTTTNITWDPVAGDYDTTETKIANDKNFVVMRFEFTGPATAVERHEVRFVTPDDFVLEQNYPNPFNPTTTISYDLPLNKQVSLKIYNTMGQLVRTLVDDQLQVAGQHKVVWDGLNDAGSRVATGVYIYSLEFGNFSKSRRMTLVK
ncbi:T9SS type A sorting domain-containing protein [candidate division KSB1 bacterium]|nr:T9SS type A sorting domain-containing protein [candidate division KSB1 bacterium]